MSLRRKLENLIGEKKYQSLRNFRSLRINLPVLIKNYFLDFILYINHSNIFFKDNFEKIEADIILKYHSLEKGFLHEKIKDRFGKNNIVILNKLLKKKEVILNKNLSQISSAYQVMCDYYELHLDRGIDISDYFDRDEYLLYKSLKSSNTNSVKNHLFESYFDKSNDNFKNFSNSRSSVRNFTDEKIPIPIIKDVITLARNAPSVCNRQPVKVYYVDNRSQIDEVFKIQGGLTGYSQGVKQLMVVVSDRNYYYSVGERNQLFIDGGIFLMNLLYSLHFYKIGACPAHWGLNNESDKKIREILNLKKSEKVVSLVAIGIPNEKFKTCKSSRRDISEILILNK